MSSPSGPMAHCGAGWRTGRGRSGAAYVQASRPGQQRAASEQVPNRSTSSQSIPWHDAGAWGRRARRVVRPRRSRPALFRLAQLAAAKQDANQLDVFAVHTTEPSRHVGCRRWILVRRRTRPPQPARLSRALWMPDWGAWPHIHGTPVRQFPITPTSMSGRRRITSPYPWLGTRFDESRKKLGTDSRGQLILAPDGMPGGMLSLAIDPTRPRSGVLFASLSNDARTDGPGILRAFDAVTLRELWNNAGDEYLFSKFVPPTIAAGQVFLPTCSGQVIVYGK